MSRQYEIFKKIRKPVAPPSKVFKDKKDSQKYKTDWSRYEYCDE